MNCPMVPSSVTLSDPKPRFQGHGVISKPISALNVLCAQLTRDLFAIAMFLFFFVSTCTRPPKRFNSNQVSFHFRLFILMLSLDYHSFPVTTRDHRLRTVSPDLLEVHNFAKAELCDRCCLSFCEQDNSWTRWRTSTKHDRHGQGRCDPLEVTKTVQPTTVGM